MLSNLKTFTFNKEYNLIATNSFWRESNCHLTATICFNRHDLIIRKEQLNATEGWETETFHYINIAISLSYNVKIVIKRGKKKKKKRTDSLVTVIKSE